MIRLIFVASVLLFAVVTACGLADMHRSIR